MTIEEGPDPSFTSQHQVLDWFEGPIPFLPTFLDEPYCPPEDELSSYQWWNPDLSQDQPVGFVESPAFNTNPTISAAASAASTQSPEVLLSRKRKQPDDPTAIHKPPNRQKRDANGGNEQDEEDNRVEGEVQTRKPAKKSQVSKANGGSSSNAGDGRWAEHLLNPCAAAIDAADTSRVHHLLVVLKELSSPSGDTNHRLAHHGLRGLVHYLSSTAGRSRIRVEVPGGGDAEGAVPRSEKFASTEPRQLQNALMKFQEVSPWFAFPNSLANASILQTLKQRSSSATSSSSSAQRPRNLHVIDIGVSHGIQWPTLLEPLARLPGEPPPLVRLTVVDGLPQAPFSTAPRGYNCDTHLLRYAKLLELNLEIDHHSGVLERDLLAPTAGDATTLVVCAQFRLHQLAHHDGERSAFLGSIRELHPDLVVLSEVDGEGCCCDSCCGAQGGFAAGFGRRVEFLWRFLDSTNAAFKGRDCEERRTMEGEAARAVEEPGMAVGERREGWWEDMEAAGFVGERLGEEAVDGGRALLRKYGGNWEMRVVEEKGKGKGGEGGGVGGVCLCWKGQPVSFCSLWRPAR